MAKRKTRKLAQRQEQTTLFEHEKRDQVLPIRLTKSEKDLLKATAYKQGYSTLAGFARQKLISLARKGR